jgi:Leucine Rich repeat
MHQLDMGNNSMTAEGAASLAAYMETHRELRELNLYMNDIGSAGLEKVLCCKSFTQKCWLVPAAWYHESGLLCCTGLAGMAAGLTRMLCCLKIAAALKDSKHIKALDLGGNNITADGVKVMHVGRRAPSVSQSAEGFS